MKRYFVLLLGATILWILAAGGPLRDGSTSATGAGREAPTGGFDCADVTEIPQGECEALVTFYNATNGSAWWDRSGWLVTTTPCTWFGVTCTAGHVTEMDLWFNNVGGALPSALANLTQLKVLEVGGWQLSGVIPPELGTLTQLQQLKLGWNQEPLSIPPQLGDLPLLEILEIRKYLTPAVAGALSEQLELRGAVPIPPELGNLANLEELYLNWSVSGPIPPELGNLSNLRVLNLEDNQWLSGSIPPEFGNLSNLTHLDLSYPLWACQVYGPPAGDLTGSLPAELGNLSNLQYLDLYCQKFTGPFPMTFTQLGELQLLHYHGTDLCEPFDPIFQDWIAGVPDVAPRGVLCGGQLYLPMIAK